MRRLPAQADPPDDERRRTVQGQGKEADEEDRIPPDVRQVTRILLESLDRSQVHEGRPADGDQSHRDGQNAKVEQAQASSRPCQHPFEAKPIAEPGGRGQQEQKGAKKGCLEGRPSVSTNEAWRYWLSQPGQASMNSVADGPRKSAG